jgi:quinoprotein dehydrogenase-associated probable ABC transporter substrate-binding protein
MPSAFRTTAFTLLLGALGAMPAAAQGLRPDVLKPGVLRICADPFNMPASNDKEQGYENKIADLIGKAWNSKIEYAWWPIRRGFFARALNGRYCDVAITAPTKLDMAAVTKPFFRSSYAIVYRKDSGLRLTSLSDTAFKHLKIGVNLLDSDAENTPPAMALSSHGVVGNLVGFQAFFGETTNHPEDIINAVADKQVDVAIVWGPTAGYFVSRAKVPLELHLVEADSVSGLPFAFSLGMATRRADRELRDSLQKFIDAHGSEIQQILKDYNVPLLPIHSDSTRAAG